MEIPESVVGQHAGSAGGPPRSVDEMMSTARRAEQDGDLEAAASIWKDLRSRFPEKSAGFSFGGRVLKRLRQLAEARAVFAEGIARFPQDEWIAVEHAWVLYDLGEFSQAVERFRAIRDRFPGSLSGYLGGGVASRKLGAFADADELYRAGFARFPDNEPLHSDYSWCAEEQRDIPEAIQRWQTVRARFPDTELGHVRAGVLLLNAGRFDEADAVLAEAVERYPQNADVLTSYAWVAHQRRDWSEALKRWEVVITRCQQLKDPRRLAAQALMELGRCEEAQSVLAPARRLFPDDRDIAVLSGWLATRRRDVPEAETIWRSVRERFPDDIDGYFGCALALRDVGRLDEADAMLQEAARRFPQNSTIAMDLAQLAERRLNWPLASQRWRDVLSWFPDIVAAYVGLGNSLYREGKLAEAKSIHDEGLARFPDDVDMAAAEARLASSANDWPRALQLWTNLRSRFPDDRLGYLGLGQALRDSGQLDRSEDIFIRATQRFPDDVELEVQLALTLSARREWPRALAYWESLKQRYPNSTDVRWGITQILDKAMSDQVAQGMRFEIPTLLLEADADGSDYIKAHRALFKRFESLGDTCEFGMVQRMFQADQVSLLRWAATTPVNLVTALSRRFEGVGDPQHTIIAVAGDEYTTEDRRYSMHSHTFTSPAAEPYEFFAPEQCRRIQWLRTRLIDNLTAGAKIFIYKYEDGLADADVDALYAALCTYCPEIALLCVKLEEPGHASGSIERIRGGLFVGYIDRFSTVNISVNAWISLCRSVVANLPPGSNRADLGAS